MTIGVEYPRGTTIMLYGVLGVLLQPAQTVAGDRHPLREAGRTLQQGGGDHRRLVDLVIMNHRQTLVRR